MNDGNTDAEEKVKRAVSKRAEDRGCPPPKAEKMKIK